MGIDVVGAIVGSLGAEYQSTFNFEAYQINEEEKEKLTRCEESIKQNEKKALDTMLAMCKAFDKAHKILANYNSGTFCAWYENLGYNAEYVNVIQRRYALYRETRVQNVLVAPVRLIKQLTGKNCELTTEQKLYVLNSDNRQFALESVFRQSENSNPDNIKHAKLVVDTDILMKKFTSFNKIKKSVNEKIEELSDDKKEAIYSEIEKLEKKIEKILK